MKKSKKQKAVEKRNKKKLIKYILWLVVVSIVTSTFIYFYKQNQKERLLVERKNEIYLEGIKNNKNIILEKEKRYPIQSRDHINVVDDHPAYTTNPPLSGAHASAQRGGFYSEGIKDENAIHNLEHGYIWISYKNISENDIEKVKELTNKNLGSIISSQRNENDFDGLALASWGNLMKLKVFDQVIIEDFLKRNKNKSPEKLAK